MDPERLTTLPPGMATDIGVLLMEGAQLTDHDDHLVVRTPQNPHFHWGHSVLVTDPAAVDDAHRWLSVFTRCFPRVKWRAVGLVVPPSAAGRTAWAGRGVAVTDDDVLATRALPRLAARPEGYEVRALGDDDWYLRISMRLADPEEAARHDPVLYRAYLIAQTNGYRRLVDQGRGQWFGAFRDGELAADLGIVRCGKRARYQQVMTAPAHRCRGLTTHLLGVAARWAAENGCDEWVILTDAGNPAGRVYRSVGFKPVPPSASAYRAPGRSR